MWAEGTSCSGLSALLDIGQVQTCADELIEKATEAQSRALKKSLGSLQEIRSSCTAANENSSMWGCKALSDLAYELFAEATALQQVCQAAETPAACDERGNEAALGLVHAWHYTESRFQNTPAESMVTSRLARMREELFGAIAGGRLGEGEAALPPMWNVTMRAVEKLRQWVSGYIWRETHWLWLMDSIQAGRVVQTTWGDADEWLKFGVHDAHAEAPLSRAPPRYVFSEHLGMRWEIMVQLLKELRARRGDQGLLQVVEIGVFAGHLSHFLLRDCDFIHLLGIDPYFGRDGTFPGNFSESLDSDIALYKAASVYEPHGERAQLLPATSEAAAAEIQDGTVDAIFIDGCHLYDCVKQDFELWLPKMRRGLPVLVAGHDFSPQWPGVVRAVHEQREGGQEVSLASDWLFWWFDEYS